MVFHPCNICSGHLTILLLYVVLQNYFWQHFLLLKHCFVEVVHYQWLQLFKMAQLTLFVKYESCFSKYFISLNDYLYLYDMLKLISFLLHYPPIFMYSLHILVNCRNLTLAKCAGEAQHLEKVGIGVLRDSQKLKRRFGKTKHLALRCSWCHWKGLET